jgi:hypothetical protein
MAQSAKRKAEIVFLFYWLLCAMRYALCAFFVEKGIEIA